MPNEQDTRDDKWQDLLNLEDAEIKTLTDGNVDSVLFTDWIDKKDDSTDYMRFRLNETAKIILTVNAEATAKYTLYRYENGSLVSIQTASLSKNKAVKRKNQYGETYMEYPEWDYSATTKSRLLTEGDYFLCVQAKDKTDGSRYNVYLTGDSAFFTGKGNPNDNDWKSIHEAEESDYNLGMLESPAEDTLAEGWVGYNDPSAWRKFTLRKKARLSFTIYSSDSTKFTLWYYDETKQAPKSVLTVKPKKVSDDEEEAPEYELMAQTREKLLKSGTYFFSVDSTNADKGGNAYYSVYIAPGGEFFGAKGNNNDDTTDLILNDEKNQFRFDSNILIENEWVGCDDEFDYRVFSLVDAAILSFTINASSLVKFTVFEFAVDGRGRTYQKKVLSISPGKTSVKKVKIDEDEWETIYPEANYSATTDGKLFESGKDYFICIQSRNAAKGGSSDYSLYLNEDQCYTFRNVADYNNWTDIADNGFASTELEDAGYLMLGSSRVFSGWVGHGDDVDYCRFSLASKAKLKFQINASDSVKFIIYKVTGTEGRYSKKQLLASTTAKAKKYYDNDMEEWVWPEWGYSKKTAAVQLAAGDYVICVQSTNAAKGGHADFEVELLGDQSTFDNNSISFNKVYGPDQKAPDYGWNSWLYDSKARMLNEEIASSMGNELDGNTEEILLDQSGSVCFEYNGTEFHNWVGDGDEFDYAKITLTSAAKLSFTIDSTDAAMFSIWSLVYKSYGTYSANMLQSTALLLDQNTNSFHVTTQGVMLSEGTYYISMQSLNATIGGSAYYNVKLDQLQSSFFDMGDNSNDYAPTLFYTDGTVLNGYNQEIILDQNNPVSFNFNETEFHNWVGYGDTVDYAKITLTSDAILIFQVSATDEMSFSVVQMTQTPKGGFTQKTLSTTTLKKVASRGVFIANTKSIRLVAGDYYVCAESLNAARGGSAYYNVEVMMTAVNNACALDMPETDALNLTDDLRFGQYAANADALAGASVASLAELDGISAMQDLMTLA